MRKSQFSEEQIIGILRLVDAGRKVGEVGSTEATVDTPCAD